MKKIASTGFFVIIAMSFCVLLVNAGFGTVTNCSCSDCHATSNFTTDTCFQLSDTVSGFHSESKRVVTCDDAPATCAHFTFFKEPTRTCEGANYRGSAAMVCGECDRFVHVDERTNVTTTKYRKIECNETTGETSIDEDCNSDCSSCAIKQDAPHPYLACSSGLHNGFSVYNQGLFPCATITEKVYPEGDYYCNGTAGPHAAFKVPQFSCSFGLKWQCNNPPALPAPKTDKINVQTCRGEGCTDCTSVTQDSGSCHAGTKYTCGATQGTCAHLIIHNGTTGCNHFQGLFNVPCGGCNRWPHANDWSKTICDMNTGYVTYERHCNSDCTVCNKTDVVRRPPFTCEQSDYNPTMWIYNRGLFPCYTATRETGFQSDTTCSGNSSTQIQESQGVCEYDHVYQCQLDAQWTGGTGVAIHVDPPGGDGDGDHEHHMVVALVIGITLACIFLVVGVFFAWKQLRAKKVQQDITELEEKLYGDE